MDLSFNCPRSFSFLSTGFFVQHPTLGQNDYYVDCGHEVDEDGGMFGFEVSSEIKLIPVGQGHCKSRRLIIGALNHLNRLWSPQDQYNKRTAGNAVPLK